MDLILCRQTVDFDALGAAVGLSCLKIDSRIVLAGGVHPAVKDFLALYRDKLSLIELSSINPEQIRTLMVVNSQKYDHLGTVSSWFDLPHIKIIEIYDHHLDTTSGLDIPATFTEIEPVGATTTLIVERMQRESVYPNPIEATVMALGIHVNTGSLTFSQSTPRDAYALAWLMEKGANIKTIAEYCDSGFSSKLQQFLQEALENFQKTDINGYTITSVLLTTETLISGLSNLAKKLIKLTKSDALLLGHFYDKNRNDKPYKKGCLTIIGRTRIEGINLNQLFQVYGGVGHEQAVYLKFHGVEPKSTLDKLFQELITQIPYPLTARDLMSFPVRTIRPETTIEQAQKILFRYGHSGLSVVDESDHLVGIISRRDIDLAFHHGLSHTPVKGYIAQHLKTITPDTMLPEIESMMVTNDVERLPVVENNKLLGIVTRTDLLRQIYQDRRKKQDNNSKLIPLVSSFLPSISQRLSSPIWKFLQFAAKEAEKQGWHLYIVGGAVRDFFLSKEEKFLLLQDIDLVVDGFRHSADVGAGVELASTLRKTFPNSRLSVHGEFQTAALSWHRDPQLGSLWVDIATSRTEFYPYPAANPKVEASSIRQDLYRRDFTINALAVRLTSPREGELLDFFGGMLDLQLRKIRALHANSFIEDPTRIYRAVRFAVRLGFEIEPQTKAYINNAVKSGIYDQLIIKNYAVPALKTRLKTELKYILEANYWKPSLKLLADLNALSCLHNRLILDDILWWQVRYISRWLRYLDPKNNLEHWLIRLEVLISRLEIAESSKIALDFQLPKDSIQRLKTLSKIELDIKDKLLKYNTTSEITRLFNSYQLPVLILVAVRFSKQIRRTIWQFITKWSNVQPLLNGNDLKTMGYKPGPKYKIILDRLLSASLDKKIQTKKEAEELVKQMMSD
ncbi:poly(A) polymerase/tRNA nucleotidyltransferase family protein [cyanobacterium endosymbiont of Rhopalodia gibberula]|uniref:CBS domain-containing protein n=1 Tax=cyanobacterium endosymbiont of Rhopalodia gibberula TaxID=1763363 RepID=UPI000DC6F68F|nr:CBS domain-containing protein [cyanobacterium endosymbiont of Rhopalodia gibberula]BBA79791.1 poly(A) polymerase/tRNA nucleotidyltransferase family protein [cyanobacterium endosymbiont of Rhopalodia gibberula]